METRCIISVYRKYRQNIIGLVRVTTRNNPINPTSSFLYSYVEKGGRKLDVALNNT